MSIFIRLDVVVAARTGRPRRPRSCGRRRALPELGPRLATPARPAIWDSPNRPRDELERARLRGHGGGRDGPALLQAVGRYHPPEHLQVHRIGLEAVQRGARPSAHDEGAEQPDVAAEIQHRRAVRLREHRRGRGRRLVAAGIVSGAEDLFEDVQVPGAMRAGRPSGPTPAGDSRPRGAWALGELLAHDEAERAVQGTCGAPRPAQASRGVRAEQRGRRPGRA